MMRHNVIQLTVHVRIKRKHMFPQLWAQVIISIRNIFSYLNNLNWTRELRSHFLFSPKTDKRQRKCSVFEYQIDKGQV